MDYFIDLSKSAVLSKHIAGMCSEASDATYTRHSDIQLWGTLPGKQTKVHHNVLYSQFSLF